jgi:hypothetical protein
MLELRLTMKMDLIFEQIKDLDMLEILISRAKNDGQISGVVPHLVDDGL